MGRWTHDDKGSLFRDGMQVLSQDMEHTLNADCDAYEARIAELEAALAAMTEAAEEMEYVCGLHNNRIHEQAAELARVKAESLRVVEDGEPCLLDDSGPFFMLYEGAVYSYGEHNAWYEVSDPFRCCDASPAATVTPVRLERWETEE